MILPELIVSTSLISLAFFVWAVLAKIKKGGNLESSSSSSSSTTGDDDLDVVPAKEDVIPAAHEATGVVDPLGESSSSSVCGLESCGSSVCSDSNKDETPLSSSPGTPKTGSGLSRRQRKNRKREEKKSISPKLSRTSSEETRPDAYLPLTRSKKLSVPCREYTFLNLPDQATYQMLSVYTLSVDHLRLLGYPMESSKQGKAFIYKDPDLTLPGGGPPDLDDPDDIVDDDASAESTVSQLDATSECTVTTMDVTSECTVTRLDAPSECTVTRLDATAQPFFPEKSKDFMLKKYSAPVLNATAKEFVPSSEAYSWKMSLQHVNSTPNLSYTEELSESLAQHSYSLSSSKADISRVGSDSSINKLEVDENSLEERVCVRCSKPFYMYRSGEYFTKEPCSYHWGKLRSSGDKNNPVYECCGQISKKSSLSGCATASLHVWSGLKSGVRVHGPLDGYVKTKPRRSRPKEGNYGVYGVDCEMCYTKVGLELTKVTVVGVDGRLIYESLVNPENEIIDHNTRFSGITAEELRRGPTKALKEVQNDLNGFINADSILVGHGLENDLRALNLIHCCIIDTSIIFPHWFGLPFRRSLRSLASSYLKREIQTNECGHDSYEDARAGVELMLWKARKDMGKGHLAAVHRRNL